MSQPVHTFFLGVMSAVLLAVSAPGHGNVHDQLVEVDRLLVQEPDAAHLHVRRANLHRLDGAYDRALDDYLRARELDPDFPALDYMEAETLRHAGRHREALESYARFLITQPDHPGAHHGRARSLAALGRDAEASAAFDAALEDTASPDPGILLERARVEVRRGPEHVDRALAGLDEGIRVLGPIPALVKETITIEVRCGRTDRALERIDAMLAGPGHGDHWLVIRAGILADAGRADEAMDTYARALAAIEALPPHRRSTPALLRRVRDIEMRRTEIRP